MNDLSQKTILITGGTGSFGKAMVKHIIETVPEIKEIRIFSRDELKQELMRIEYSNPKLKFYIGDVRDIDSVNNVMQGVDYIFIYERSRLCVSCCSA